MTMRTRSYVRLRETVFDLYTERDNLPWYFKSIALVSAWLLLVAYVLFSLVFTTQEDDLQTNRSLVTVISGIALIVGYVCILSTAFLSHSLLFIFDSLLLPTFSSSLIGSFTTVINYSLHKSLPVINRSYIYIPLIVSCSTTIVSGLLSAFVYRKLATIKKLDERRRSHIPMDQHVGSPSLAETNHELMSFVPDDEPTRRQLLRLLLARDDRNNSVEDASTYKIDLPGENTETISMHGEITPATSRWTLSAVLPGRGRSPSAESFKPPRERRREEIERSSMLSPPVGHLEGGWPGQSQSMPAWSTEPLRFG